MAEARETQPKKVRIQLLIDESINQLLEQLAKQQRRTRSAIVELALLAYAQKSGPDRSV
jgi:hypothetical protein